MFFNLLESCNFDVYIEINSEEQLFKLMEKSLNKAISSYSFFSSFVSLTFIYIKILNPTFRVR